jgi:hypothetical protein
MKPPGLAAPPLIGFDHPGYDGRGGQPAWTSDGPSPDELALLDHLSNLLRILRRIEAEQQA